MMHTVYLLETPQVMLERLMTNVEKVWIGKRDVVEKSVTALLAGGHILLEDVPGTGKTVLARALARSVDCDFKRIPFTPDLMPADITGVSIYSSRSEQFSFQKGPIFAHMVLADELNRASPKTQAALLEAMEERQVTADGVVYPLPEPFLLLATQNPLGQAGTYALPEAQMDRFLLRIELGYPDLSQEVALLSRRQDKHPLETLKPVMLREELGELQRLTRQVHVEDAVKRYIASLSAATRNEPGVRIGASPRASLALMAASKAHAMLQGRTYVIPDDVKKMAIPVLAHRLFKTSVWDERSQAPEQVVQHLLERTRITGLPYAAGG